MQTNTTTLPTKISIADAIALGHKYFIEEEDGERLHLLTDYADGKHLTNGSLDTELVKYVLCEKQPRHYVMSADDICDVIVSQVESQDEFGDEDSTLVDSVHDAFKERPDLFHELSKVLNEQFHARDFYFGTKTEIIF